MSNMMEEKYGYIENVKNKKIMMELLKNIDEKLPTRRISKLIWEIKINRKTNR